MNLYQLTKEEIRIDFALQELELEDGTEVNLEKKIELELERMNVEALKFDKFEAILRIRKNHEALAVARKNEAKALSALAKQSEKRVEALDNYVANNLKVGEKFDCSVGAYSWRKSSKCEPTERNLDQSAPKKFIKWTPSVMIAEIKAVIAAGKKVKGWVVKEYQNLQVK